MRNDKIRFFKNLPFSDSIEVFCFENVIVIEYWEDTLDVYCDDGLPCHIVDYNDFDFFIVGDKND